MVMKEHDDDLKWELPIDSNGFTLILIKVCSISNAAQRLRFINRCVAHDCNIIEITNGHC